MSSPRSASPAVSDENQHPPASPPSSNRFQRLFSENDEIRLLKQFHKITKSLDHPVSPAAADPSALGRLSKALNNKFTDSQICNKLRHMKDKYRKHAKNKSLIKTPHDHKAFAIARKIWGRGSSAPPRNTPEEAGEEKEASPGEADGVNLENFPVLVKEVSRSLAGNGVGEKLLSNLGEKKVRELNEKWIMLRIEEAKIVAKRAELEKEQLEALLKATVSGNGN